MAALKLRKEKVQGKVSRAEKALESAQKELTDLLAAERVLGDITGESPEPKSGEGTVSDRDIKIARLLSSEPAEAISPAALLPKYIEETGDHINLEAFRTAVWRLLKKTIVGEAKSWVVKSEGGKYWREAVVPPVVEDDFDGFADVEGEGDPFA